MGNRGSRGKAKAEEWVSLGEFEVKISEGPGITLRKDGVVTVLSEEEIIVLFASLGQRCTWCHEGSLEYFERNKQGNLCLVCERCSASHLYVEGEFLAEIGGPPSSSNLN
ncbi:hypothetical protein HYW30_01665 [Candidatus Azambacteria bacterium]|nr:hypothetical protein [Candidatus Azambacteria bacterium]